MRLGDLPHRTNRRPIRLNLNYLDAGLVAGAAAFSSLAGVLLTGALPLSPPITAGLTSDFAGAATTAGFTSSFLAGSAAKAVTAKADAIKVAISFMICPLRLV